MATIYRRGKNWYLNVSVNGKPVRRSLGPNERLARLRLAEVQAEIERGRAGFPTSRPAPLRERIDTWLATHGRTLAPRTLVRCRQYADRALELLDGDRPLSREDLVRYQAVRLEAGRRAKTVNNEVAWLQQVCRDDDGRLPWRRVPKLKIRDARPVRWLTTDEVRRLLSAALPRARPYLLGYLYTGARREELISVRWEDVDMVRGTIRLHSAKTAGRRPGDTTRTVPLHPALRGPLEAAQAANLASPWPAPQDQHRLRNWVVTAAARAGITPRPTLHDLRHTYASHLVQAGVSLYVVGRLLGHTNPTTTAIYAHLAPSTYEAAVSLLGY